MFQCHGPDFRSDVPTCPPEIFVVKHVIVAILIRVLKQSILRSIMEQSADDLFADLKGAEAQGEDLFADLEAANAHGEGSRDTDIGVPSLHTFDNRVSDEGEVVHADEGEDLFADLLAAQQDVDNDVPVATGRKRKRVQGEDRAPLDKTSRAWGLYLQSCRSKKEQATRSESAAIGTRALQGAWNHERLHNGRHVGDRDGSQPLQYTMHGVLQMAWRQVGQKKVVRDGLDGSHHELEALCAVSAAAAKAQTEIVQQTIEQILDSPKPSLVIKRFYDATPVRVGFGALQAVVAPHARYPWWDEAENKWKSLSLSKLRENLGCPSGIFRKGVLELFAQGASFHWVDSLGHYHSRRVFCPPTFLERGNAPCIAGALHNGVPQVSLDGLRSLCAKCEYVLINELPDACKPNLRCRAWYAHSTAGIPGGTVLHPMLTCSCHQAQRIVDSTERMSVGDIYAIRFTCSQHTIQAKLQVALKKWLRSLVYLRGKTTPETLARNRLIMQRTMRRRGCGITGSLELDDLGSDAELFLKVWNGSWLGTLPVHHCSGCCDNAEHAQERLFSSAIALDLLQSNEAHMPSMDDWGSSGEAAAATGLGLMVHDVLKQVFDIGLPTWQELGEGGVAEDEDDEIEHRRKVQKKAWRSRCVLRSEDKRLKILLLCWMASPIEQLMSQLQFLDGTRNAILDRVQGGSQNPFLQCRRQLAEIISRGRTGVLKPLYDAWPEERWTYMDGAIREMGLQFSSQVAWRFLALFEFPFLFTHLLRRGMSDQEKLDVLEKFFDREECCHDEWFGLRIRRTHTGPQHLFDDKAFREVLAAWALSFCFTNMWCERLLASIRNRTRHTDMHIERLVSVGMLLQLLLEHNRLGRQDPLVVKVEQLLKAGVPLKCRPKAPVRCSRVGGAFVNFFNRLDAERKAAGIVMNKEEWIAFRAQKVQEFSQLSIEELEKDRHQTF